MTDKNTADKHAIDNNIAQGIAAYIDYLNQLRVSTLMDTLRQILNNETGQLKDLAERQANALRNLDLANQNVMNIVNSGRGGENGMHGFIAEFAQTGIANARRAFEGLEKSTITLNNNGPADLLINGKPSAGKVLCEPNERAEDICGIPFYGYDVFKGPHGRFSCGHAWR